jgi:putative ABC transport system permease protein
MKFGLEISESFNIARSAIVANKGRGTLTALGIIIGIVAVITTMTAANGLKNTFMQSFSSIGSDVLYVSRTPWVNMGNFMEFRNRKSISLEDTESLAAALHGRGVVNPGINSMQNVKYGSETLDNVNILGTTPEAVRCGLQKECGRARFSRGGSTVRRHQPAEQEIEAWPLHLQDHRGHGRAGRQFFWRA